MKLSRPHRPMAHITLIPLVDVLLILLVFFMVTSTFLDLDMFPLVEGQGAAGPAAVAPEPTTLLLRLADSGDLAAAGSTVARADLGGFLAARLEDAPDLKLLLLPSPLADVQSLVSVLDVAAGLGIADVRVIRIGEGP